MVMVSHALSPAPSSGHSRQEMNGRAAGGPSGTGHGRGERKAERAPGTPSSSSRREERHREKAVQDPGLKDYVSGYSHCVKRSGLTVSHSVSENVWGKELSGLCTRRSIGGQERLWLLNRLRLRTYRRASCG